MEMKGEYLIPASAEQVWAALNDPEVLKTSIPGCDEIEVVSPTEMKAKVTAKVGPVKAKFNGSVTLSDLVPPKSYTISGEGKGGAAGFAKGTAKINLAEEDGTTRLSYEVEATVGGKLAQVGQRLIDTTANKMAEEFFESFSEQTGGQKIVPPVEEAPEPAAEPGGIPSALWIAGLIALVGVVLYFFTG